MVSELGKRMLIIVAKRGYTGASREVFFHHIRGIKYAKLEKAVLALEREGLITIEWVGPSNFTVNITSKGVDVAKGYQEDVWRKSAEALEKVQSTKHADRSIMHDDMEYTKIIDDKMHVSEVGSIADEIITQIDKQILDERAHTGENTVEESPGAVVVPAWEETVSPGEVGVEKDVVERRISGELKYEVKDGGTVVQIGTAVESTEDRIESDEHSTETNIRERRISGEDEDLEETEEKRAPPRPPRSFVGSIPDSPPEEPAQIYTEEEAEAEALAETGLPYGEGTYDEDTYDEPSETYDEPAESATTYEEPSETYEEVQEPETPPGFSVEELLADDEAPSVIENPATEDVSYSTGDAYCVWEPECDCPILQAGATEITTDQCIICQLIQIKQSLQNR